MSTTFDKDQDNEQQQQDVQAMWEKILAPGSRITKDFVDFAIDNLESAPDVPYEFMYSEFSPASKIYQPTTIAVSGVGGIIGALLALKRALQYGGPKYYVTTEEVIKASDPKSPLYLANYALNRLLQVYPAQVVTIKPDDFDKIKTLLSSGGVYISGLPNETLIPISQLSGFGRIWHYSPIQKKFFVF
ncbi:structural protein [Acidianus two-tailed virus 2]|nr:structural protein [Acidianus two-tailed virus 2]